MIKGLGDPVDQHGRPALSFAMHMEDIKNQVIAEQHYSDCFRLLAACFYAPRKETFLEERFFTDLSNLLNRICPGIAPQATLLQSTSTQYSVEELAVEYARLFIGPFQVPAPPYGSIYLENEQRVMGETSMATLQLYQEAGLALDEECKEPPDHIAIEFEFISFLSYQISAYLSNNKESNAHDYKKIRKTFINNFLGIWLLPFAESVRAATDNDFYAALAACLTMLHPCVMKLAR